MKKALIVIFCILLSSCEIQERIPPEEYIVDNTWSSVFDAYWHGMNDNYVFWSLDSPNREWDEIYDKYSPLFAELGEISEETREKGARYFYNIMKDLNDMHYMFYLSNGNYLIFWFYAITNRNLMELGYSEDEILKGFLYFDEFEKLSEDNNYGTSEMEREHIGNIMYFTFDLPVFENFVETSSDNNSTDKKINEYFDDYMAFSHTIEEKSTFALLGKTSDKIVYFGFNSFIFSDYYEYAQGQDEELKLWGEELMEILNKFNEWIVEDDIKGLIIDLRGNTGGLNSDIPLLWGRLSDESFVYMQERSKMGDSRLDYTSWIPIRFQPDENGLAMNKDVPIVVLTNRNSASNAEVTVMIMKALQEKGRNITIMGNTTAGANGYFIDNNDVYNSGLFTVEPYIEIYRTSTLQHVYKDGTMYEGIGISPDIEVPFNWEDFQKGEDARLEAAFNHIRI